MMLLKQNRAAACCSRRIRGVESDVPNIQRKAILFCLALPDSCGNTVLTNAEGMEISESRLELVPEHL